MSDSPSALKRLITFFLPHKTIPITPWTAHSRWDVSALRIFILIAGLSVFGLGEALLIRSNSGNSPWTVLAQGVSLRTPLTIGESTFLISALVLSLWFPLREKPGFGTIANMIVIATSLQISIGFIPSIEGDFPLSLLFIFLGIGAVGMGSALYITCGLGPGPRDGLMTALHKRTGVRVGRVRLFIEFAALTIGLLLGGHAGLGTALFALLIGNSVAIAFALLHKITAFSNR